MTDLEFKDAIHQKTIVYLSFWDTIKVLLGRPVHVSVTVRTEHEVGRTQTTESEAWVPPLVIRKETAMSEGVPK